MKTSLFALVAASSIIFGCNGDKEPPKTPTDTRSTGATDTQPSTMTKVKAFANMMITQHTDAENKGKRVVEKEKLVPADSSVTTKLKGDVDTTMSALKTSTGTDFDKAYVDAQVKAHKDVLAAIDEKAMPGAKDAALKTHLEEIRKHVSMHLQKAEELRQGLTTTAATPPTKK